MAPARISTAQNFFRFAYRIGSPISHGINVIVAVPPALVVFGEHSVSADELRISERRPRLMRNPAFERLAYRLLAMELNSALEAKFGNWDARRGHGDVLICNASTVVWLIRNCVAHNILDPVWNIKDPAYRDRCFPIPDVLTFKTKDLDGMPLKR